MKEALKYLHKSNIIHRDLKPMNILMTKIDMSTTKEVVVKLADFGFARYFESKPQNSSGFDDMVSTICGSPIYMAPELLIDMKYNTKADLWSFGVIMYELLYGVNPYNYPKSIAHLRKVMVEQKIVFEKIYSSCCISLLKKLLQVNPEERISWNDFFTHKWFDKDFEKDDSEEDSDTDIEHDYIASSMYGDEFKLDTEPMQSTKLMLDSTDAPKSIMASCIEDYVSKDSTLPKAKPIPVPKTTPIDIRGKPTKPDKKINTYTEDETVGRSFIGILADSMGYLFGQARSY